MVPSDEENPMIPIKKEKLIISKGQSNMLQTHAKSRIYIQKLTAF